MWDRPPPDYEAIERKLWKQSQEDIHGEIRDKADRLLARVATFAMRFGYEEEVVLRKIEEDKMFAAHFAKEPRRTGLHQKVAGEWIRGLPDVKEFEVLPSHGSKAMKVTSDGNLETEHEGKTLPGKSLDFRWKTGTKTFYAMHKYTKEGGGNQDSQYKEMVELMRRFMLCCDEGIVLVVIVDGQYYLENRRKRLNRLKSFERPSPPRSSALTIEELPKILEEYQP